MVRVSEQSRSARPIRAPDAEALIDLGVSIDGAHRGRRALRTAAACGSCPWTPTPPSSSVEGTDIAGRASTSTVSAGSPTRAGSVGWTRTGSPPTCPSVSDEVTGPVTSVQLARDGARLVLVVDGQLHLGVIRAGAEGRRWCRCAGSPPPSRGPRRGLAQLDDPRRAGVDELRATCRCCGSGWAPGTPSRSARPRAAGGGRGAGLGDPRSTVGDLLFANVGLQWRAQGTARSVAYPG